MSMTSIRESLGSDHLEISRRLSELTEAVEGANFPTIQAVLREVDIGLSAHMEGEEKYLFTHFEGPHPEEIAQLRREHEGFRRSIDELAIQADLHTLRKEPIDDLVARLRAHADKENRSLYRWADEGLSEPRHDALFQFLEERRMSLREEI